MGFVLSKLWKKVSGAQNEAIKVCIVGMQNSGKSTILYKLSLDEIVVT